MKQTIAIDAMGGDFGPSVTVPSALSALRTQDDLFLVLVGDEGRIQKELGEGFSHERLSIRHATQVVTSDEPPAQALRGKKDSSMRVAINMVKAGEADACVSAGNTGALMATAKFVLRTLPGIDRPAICSTMPAIKGHTHVLDLGANLECKAENLLQFAVMGAELTKAVDGIANPRVGLLNIGSEDIKGSDTVRRAGQLMAESDLNYIGFVEGNDIFTGDVDVVVTDGWTGNVLLKTSEGVGKFVKHTMTQNFKKNIFTKLAALVSLPVLKALGRDFDPRRHNGASLLGLPGIVVKSHGGADELAFYTAIQVASKEVESGVPAKIDKFLEAMLISKESKADV